MDANVLLECLEAKRNENPSSAAPFAVRHRIWKKIYWKLKQRDLRWHMCASNLAKMPKFLPGISISMAPIAPGTMGVMIPFMNVLDSTAKYEIDPFVPICIRASQIKNSFALNVSPSLLGNCDTLSNFWIYYYDLEILQFKIIGIEMNATIKGNNLQPYLRIITQQLPSNAFATPDRDSK